MLRFRRPIVAIPLAMVLALLGLLAVQVGAGARGNVGAPVRQSSPSATDHTIAVGGHGETAVAPDMATITIGVQSKGDDARQAMSTNADKMNAVIAAIKAQGVPDNHIKTNNISLYRDSQNDTYVASNDVTVRVDNVGNTGSVLDAAVAAGANNTWGIDFGLKDQSAARSQALQAAIADARKRADAMATALGVSITGVGSASEATYNVVPPIRYGVASAAPAPGAPTPVQPGQLNVSADVNVVFTFG